MFRKCPIWDVVLFRLGHNFEKQNQIKQTVEGGKSGTETGGRKRYQHGTATPKVGLPSTSFLTCKTRWTNRFLMTAVLLRIHAALCGATPSADLWPAKSWSRAKAKRMFQSPPAHSLIQRTAKKGSSSTQQAFGSAYIYCSTRFPSHKLMQTCVSYNSRFLITIFWCGVQVQKDPTFGRSLEEHMHEQDRFRNREMFLRQHLKLKCKLSDSRGGSMWTLGVWPPKTGSYMAEKPWKPAALNAKSFFYYFIL